MASSSTRHAPGFYPTPSKSTLAPPAVDTDTVELKDMMASSPPPELELKDDIIKLSVNGDEAAVRALLDSGKVTADWLGEDGVGPLHVLWPLVPPPFSPYLIIPNLYRRG